MSATVLLPKTKPATIHTWVPHLPSSSCSHPNVPVPGAQLYGERLITLGRCLPQQTSIPSRARPRTLQQPADADPTPDGFALYLAYNSPIDHIAPFGVRPFPAKRVATSSPHEQGASALLRSPVDGAPTFPSPEYGPGQAASLRPDTIYHTIR